MEPMKKVACCLSTYHTWLWWLQVQDVGLILLSSMASDVAAATSDYSPKVTMGTTLVTHAIAAAVTGVS